MKSTPGADAPLQRAAHALVQLGMASQHLLEDGHGSDAGRGLEQRNDLFVENAGKRIGTTPAA